MMSVSDFVDDVVAYRAWLNAHPNSYVLNTTRTPTSTTCRCRANVSSGELPTQG